MPICRLELIMKEMPRHKPSLAEVVDVTIHLSDGQTIVGAEARSPILKADLTLASNNAITDHLLLLVVMQRPGVCFIMS